jgi:hypothetical protein
VFGSSIVLGFARMGLKSKRERERDCRVKGKESRGGERDTASRGATSKKEDR